MNDPAQPSLEKLVTATFRSWRAGGVDFLVLRNYEGLPRTTTNDIDVLVRRNQRGKADRLLVHAAATAGFRVHNRAEFATLAIYLSTPEGDAQAHFDLFVDLQWRGLDYLEAEGFLDRKVGRGSFDIPHPADEAVTNLLSYLIYTGRVKEKYRAGIAEIFRREPEAAAAPMIPVYGRPLAESVVQAGAAERWQELEAQTGALRKALARSQLLLAPARGLRSLARSVGRWWRRAVRPPGMTVVLCGPDGSGKSTVATIAIQALQATFSPAKGRQFHWKPPVFFGRRQAARLPVSNPHAAPPRNAIASVMAFAVHWLEFWLGAWFVIRPVTFTGGLVLIDRYYYDFFVDQRRYRLRVPAWLVRAGYRLLPKPDLVVLLDAPADVLRQRKQEVTMEEAERQRTAYLAFLKPLPNCRVVDASQAPGQVAADTRKAVLDAAARRLRRL